MIAKVKMKEKWRSVTGAQLTEGEESPPQPFFEKNARLDFRKKCPDRVHLLVKFLFQKGEKKTKIFWPFSVAL